MTGAECVAELEAAATHVQHRPGGLVVDYLGCGPFVSDSPLIGDRRLALCRCVHGKEWPEGDAYEDAGGSACRECAEAGDRA